MEDSSSMKSTDSTGTSEEYEIVENSNGLSNPAGNAANSDSGPTLNIANNGNMEDLQKQLSEVMIEKTSNSSTPTEHSPKTNSNNCEEVENTPETFVDPNTAEKSHDCDNEGNKCQPQSLDGDYTIFNRVLYMGAASISSSKSLDEINRSIAILNYNSAQSDVAIEVSVSVPSTSEGLVIVYDATTNTQMAEFRINCIHMCIKGLTDTPQACCFAFSCSHGETEDTSIYQCHVFRCLIPEAVERVVSTFGAAFKRIPKSKLSKGEDKQLISPLNLHHQYEFEVSLEIKEKDIKGNFNTVPRDKEYFKLRSQTQKEIVVTVVPASTNNHTIGNAIELNIEKCFGVLLAPGRRVKHADMNLLETLKMGNNGEKKGYSIVGYLDPDDPAYPAFAVLNYESEKERSSYITVAIHLVIKGIQDPVRFVIETKVRIFPQTERFWYFTKKNLTHLFSLHLKQIENSDQGDPQFEIVSTDNLGEVDRYRSSALSLSLHLSSLTSSTLSSISGGRSPSIASIETPAGDDDSEDDEPLLSGSGEVSKDCPEGELNKWDSILPKLRQGLSPLPKDVISLIKRGIPEALRGQVWLLLAGCHDNTTMMDDYRILITKECSSDQVILRDINRTFPAHNFFKESGGVGQDSLYKISKAYAVYDEEIGYCQGLSFLAASLLLHMPEEETFCVLVKIMFDFGLRDLFKDNFEVLHLRFYQLDRLMEEQCPDLLNHFRAQGVESHMFASQWFLTLYTAKFPLFMVYHYLDIFLLLGHDSIFQVAIALLQMSKKELLALDFEGMLEHFRVSLPKKYRSEDAARQLFKIATSVKVKKVAKYEKEYVAMKAQEAMQVDPVVTLETMNKTLQADKMRLERENDDLANDLVNSKFSMQKKLDELEKRIEVTTMELSNIKTVLLDVEEEKKRLLEESCRVKELLKHEVEKGERDNTHNSKLIEEYKTICAGLSKRLDDQQTSHTQLINIYKDKVASCVKCSGLLSPASGPPTNVEENSPAYVRLQQENRELEMELAKTKLALVEAQCRNQDLTHELNNTISELNSSKNTWLQKTLTSFSSLKERTGSISGTQGLGSNSLTQSSSSNSLISHTAITSQDKG